MHLETALPSKQCLWGDLVSSPADLAATQSGAANADFKYSRHCWGEGAWRCVGMRSSFLHSSFSLLSPSPSQLSANLFEVLTLLSVFTSVLHSIYIEHLHCQERPESHRQSGLGHGEINIQAGDRTRTLCLALGTCRILEDLSSISM